ncbi:MAG: nucleotide sugar dehydrogenase [Chitinophagales bacterium]|nr:nucleotide sugar dehydrogenase [Chitinophagales bacterium]
MLHCRVGVIGLGYVGLPLALAFGEHYRVVGYDIDVNRVSELQQGKDHTGQIRAEELLASSVVFVSDANKLKDCTVYIITVPTPVHPDKTPDLSALEAATKQIAQLLKKGDLVIYESTVYPGCTEDFCVPILSRVSGLIYNQDFYCGYSPERISPGDPLRQLKQVVKLTSGSTSEIAGVVDNLYKQIITAGTYKAASIKVAEAAKAIENAQRDLNISFMNELALIFDKMEIDTQDVLDAAATKWNFLPFKPGLVGGHCIAVDPYYLVHKANELGYAPRVISSGRAVNDEMAEFMAAKLVKALLKRNVAIKETKALILGITFKENCPDIRNTQVPFLKAALDSYDMQVAVHDPIADEEEVMKHTGIHLIDNPSLDHYQVIILAVPHQALLQLDLASWKQQPNAFLFDIKSVLDRSLVDLRL